ncbi:MAG: hypothetical protein FJX77_15260, partial [Armatimonadetes bacterium]|nr:hypothetical protein [Armatimonadota bacterium]
MPSQECTPGWRAGVAECDITPPVGVDMTGYGNRPGPSTHLLDPLAVRALALVPPEGAPFLLTCADLLGLDRGSIARIRQALAPLVPPERLLLNHSHTHAGPTTASLRAMGRPDPLYIELVERWTVTAVREALRNLTPVRLLFGTAPSQIGLNRRELRQGRIVLGENPAGRYDPAVSVLRVEARGSGRPFACWFSHATHPVVMGPSNTGISAEWPGAAAATLRAALDCPAIFALGCCGDINPVRRGHHDVVRSVGRELAGAAMIAWERAVPLDRFGRSWASCARETVPLPLQIPAVAEAEAALAGAEERLAELRVTPSGAALSEAQARRMVVPSLVEWAREHLAAARHGEAGTVPMDVQGIRLGDLTLMATAAETFLAYSDAARERSRTRHTVSLGYTNGCFGYLPTADEFPRGGYEVDTA